MRGDNNVSETEAAGSVVLIVQQKSTDLPMRNPGKEKNNRREVVRINKSSFDRLADSIDAMITNTNICHHDTEWQAIHASGPFVFYV